MPSRCSGGIAKRRGETRWKSVAKRTWRKPPDLPKGNGYLRTMPMSKSMAKRRFEELMQDYTEVYADRLDDGTFVLRYRGRREIK
jgi:hypothetical protein